MKELNDSFDNLSLFITFHTYREILVLNTEMIGTITAGNNDSW